MCARKQHVIFWSWINSVLWTFKINFAEDMLKIPVPNSPVLCLASSWFHPVVVCSFLSLKSIIFCSQWHLRSLCLQKWMVIIMFFNSKYICKATSPRGPSVWCLLCCWGRAGPKAVSRVMDVSLLGTALLDLACIAIRRVKRKAAQRGVLGKAQGASWLVISPACWKALPTSVAQMTELVWVSIY